MAQQTLIPPARPLPGGKISNRSCSSLLEQQLHLSAPAAGHWQALAAKDTRKTGKPQ